MFQTLKLYNENMNTELVGFFFGLAFLIFFAFVFQRKKNQLNLK
jgi:hypothetical protein